MRLDGVSSKDCNFHRQETCRKNNYSHRNHHLRRDSRRRNRHNLSNLPVNRRSQLQPPLKRLDPTPISIRSQRRQIKALRTLPRPFHNRPALKTFTLAMVGPIPCPHHSKAESSVGRLNLTQDYFFS